MKWIAFAALDVYIGLIILESLIPSLPGGKLPRAKLARVLILLVLGVLAVSFLGMLVSRWIRPR